MISFDMKSETKTSSHSPLNLSTPSDEPTLSFSELLRGVNEKKDDKLIQNGSLVLSFADEGKDAKSSKSISKGDALLSLLKNEDTLPLKTKEEPLELNPKIMPTLTTKEIKVLVIDAKNYLKAKILDSDDFKKSTIKELPKTLKGLVEVAKKFGIDISKITVEEVKVHSDAKPNTKLEEVKVHSDAKPNTKLEDVKVHSDAKSNTKLEDVKTLVVQEDNKGPQKEVVQDKKAAISEVVQNKSKVAKTASISQIEQTQQVKEIKSDDKFVQVQKEIKSTPLFKAGASVEHTTTQQIVEVKANSSLKVEQKTPKDKADETLKLLLRGEKPSMMNSSLTTDFSVATAKVIAPRVASDTTLARAEQGRSLEALLRGDSSSEQGTSSKIDGLAIHKADSFEVKLNEAKQMIKYLSNDIKTVIEDYKSPFTRVKIQLNPQRLGEIDLTIVQRGKNLHVNISSNNTAVNTLSMNANELRVQLSNSGINNATLNFNNSSQNGENAQQQQQQNHQKQKESHEEYGILGKFENEETNEEILSSLEIVVPNYA
ncbi:MAG: flagellar hook-length control protein FliK [Sulfurimonas sp.]|nr:flagellar hook-length control protein FliK [Sulfurimonas sp.]